jgi:hypothetical protein
MKKKIFLICSLNLFIFNVASSQNTLLDILTIVAEGLNSNNNTYNAPVPTLKDLGTVKLDVNSTSNEFWSGGKSRNYCAVPVPEGTTKWFYRATVLPIESNYSYASNETLYYLLSNNKKVDLYSPSPYGVNIKFFNHSGEIESFYQGLSTYKSYQQLNKTNTRTTLGTIDFYQPKFWIGIQNQNQMDGLKVIIEVVAMGNFNN